MLFFIRYRGVEGVHEAASGVDVSGVIAVLGLVSFPECFNMIFGPSA